MNEKSVKNFSNGKSIALVLGGAVYLGVVLLYLAFYESLMTTHFTGTLQTVARIGAFLVAANAIALPVALHFWTVTGWHKITAASFYILDILAMALNVLASNGALPVWEGFAPVTIVFVLAGWALLWITDPGQRALVKLQESIIGAQVEAVLLASDYLKTEQGEKILAEVASKLAGRIFNEHRLIGTPKDLPVNVSDEFNTLLAKVEALDPTKAGKK